MNNVLYIALCICVIIYLFFHSASAECIQLTDDRGEINSSLMDQQFCFFPSSSENYTYLLLQFDYVDTSSSEYVELQVANRYGAFDTIAKLQGNLTQLPTFQLEVNSSIISKTDPSYNGSWVAQYSFYTGEPTLSTSGC